MSKAGAVAAAHNSGIKTERKQKLQKNVSNLVSLYVEKPPISLSTPAMTAENRKMADYDSSQYNYYPGKGITDNTNVDNSAANSSRNNTDSISIFGKCFKILETDCERKKEMILEGYRTYKMDGLVYSETQRDQVATDYDDLTRAEVLALYVNRTTLEQ